MSAYFNIPKATLSRKCDGKQLKANVWDLACIVLLKEELLKDWIVRIGKNGFAMHKSRVKGGVNNIMKQTGRKNQLIDKHPIEKRYFRKLFF